MHSVTAIFWPRPSYLWYPYA